MTKLTSTAPLALGLALCLCPWVASQCGTEISNTVNNATWTPAGSPYCINATVTVNALTIQPGVTVRVSGNNSLVIAGTLQAVGTASQPIVFTAANPAMRWRGLAFRTAQPGSRLSHCQFDNTGVLPVVDLVDTVVAIDNCSFSNCRTAGVRANLAAGSLTILDYTFTDVRGVEGPLSATLAAGDLLVDGCAFVDNDCNGSGGALAATLTAGDLVVQDCSFTNNSSRDHGGAVFADLAAGQLTVSGSSFVSNSCDALGLRLSPAGGAVFVSGDALITQSQFDGNRSRGHRTEHTVLGRGGALFCTLGNTVLENCLFTGNLAEASFEVLTVNGSARAYGGAIYAAFGTLRASNCLLADNSTTTDGATDADDRGAGVFIEGLPADFVNCTIVRGKTQSTNAGGVYVAGGSPTFRNSILWFNAGAQIAGPGAPTVTYSNVEGVQVFAGTGNINLDPKFVAAPSGCDIIALGSPCIDAGDPAAADADVCFPPSLGGVRNDMGAHGGPLACGWNNTVSLTLSTDPTLATPAPLTLALAGGNPGRPAAFFITGVNGVPVLVGLPFLLTICADGTTSITVNIPATTPGTTLDFQGYSLGGTGAIVGSNPANVLFQ